MIEIHENESNENVYLLDSIENYLDHYIQLNEDSIIAENFDDFEDDECFEPNVDIVENEIKYEENDANYENDIKYEFEEKIEIPLENYEIDTTIIKRKRGRPRKGEERSNKGEPKQQLINFQCKHCDKVLKTKLGYEIHIQKHFIYECGKCGDKFHDNNSIFKHLEDSHG